jgi:hypothetical protein
MLAYLEKNCLLFGVLCDGSKRKKGDLFQVCGVPHFVFMNVHVFVFESIIGPVGVDILV